MAAVRSKDTAPEMRVRRYLWRQGFRYRLHRKDLPGTPDIVLPRYKTVIFVHGCFWHGHPGCKLFRLPSTRRTYWKQKISRNMANDILHKVQLREQGWQVIVLWECEVKGKAGLQRLSLLPEQIRAPFSQKTKPGSIR